MHRLLATNYIVGSGITMVKTIEGQLTVGQEKFAIVVARFNDLITSKLLHGAIDAIIHHGGDASQITVVWVPGAFEIPFAAKQLAKQNFDAVICLGCVIRGDTSHYDYVCSQVTNGVGKVAYEYEMPIMFGVITCDTLEQAIDRAGTKSGNIGFLTTTSAIEMISVSKQINGINK